MTKRFEEWLSTELDDRIRTTIGPGSTSRLPLYRSLEAGGRLRRLLGGVFATAGAKLAAGGLLAASAAGAGLAVSHHQPPSPPLNHGQQVSAQAEACRDQRSPGASPGIGRCVSALASRHGQEERAEHARSHHTSGAEHGLGPVGSPAPEGPPAGRGGGRHHGEEITGPTKGGPGGPGGHGPEDASGLSPLSSPQPESSPEPAESPPTPRGGPSDRLR